MSPTLDFLEQAEKQLRSCLRGLRPKLLEAQGNIEHHLKDDKSAVTEMDTFVEGELAKAMHALDPSIPFGGEERGVDFTKPTFWLADPIDGTEPFIRGLPFATNMVALINNGEPVLGVIYNFTMDDFYAAIKGQGATVNGHPIHVSDRQADRAWVVLSTIRSAPGAAGLDDSLERIVQRVRRFGASGFDYHAIAAGNLDGVIHFHGHGHEWDYAAGSLIVQEAGGRVANIGSDSYDYRNFDHITANPIIFDALMEFMVEVDQHAKNTAA
jgi:myo-inositol-1(or 4)-monophosphatase